MDFTPAQSAAITLQNSSLLISAGAGSGKTRVLTERIVRRLTDEQNPADITDFLIVTFTKAAALELSDRIRTTLAEKCAVSPSPALIRNIALLPQAKICTINSFCLDFVKEHFEKLGLPPKLRIADENECEVLADECITAILEEKLANSEEGSIFYALYDSFSGKKSDAEFIETVKALYGSLSNQPSLDGFLRDATARYEEIGSAEEIFDTRYGAALRDTLYRTVQVARDGIGDCLTALETAACEEKNYQKAEAVFEGDIETLDNLLSSLTYGYESTVAYCQNLTFARKPIIKPAEPAVSELLDRRAKLIKDVKECAASYFACDSRVFRLCAEDCLHLLRELTDFLTELDRRLWSVKKAGGIVSFSDVEHLTLELLYDDVDGGVFSPLAASVSASFRELYIDEYQDVNPIQDMIFLALSAKTPDGEECGRFLVGDAKQSIYGFRGADPAIFLQYQKDFADADNENASRKKIFMSHNFRCAEGVIRFTNALFSCIMADSYGENEKLIYARKETKQVVDPVHILLCDTDDLAENRAENRIEAEAAMLLEEIQALLADPGAVNADGKRYEYADIAILTAKWNAAKALERFFTARGIPVTCEKGESFFDRREIRLALAILSAVDNPERDIPLAAFLRSGAGGFTDDDLVKIRLFSPKISLFGALKRYADAASEQNAEASAPDTPIFPEPALAAKIRAFLERFDELRRLSRCHTASEFLRRMYAKTDLIGYCTAGTEGYGTLSPSARKKNLMLLYEKARDFDKTVFKGLSAFLEYADVLKASGDLKSCTDTTGGIRIMTIHKSKGLEFPVCFLFNADSSKKTASGGILYTETLGVTFQLKSYRAIASVGGENGYITVETPFHRLVKDALSEKERTELRRLLYVGVTRAKDRLYITASPANLSKKLLAAQSAPSETVADTESFSDWILGFASSFPAFEQLTATTDSERISFADAEGQPPLFDMRIVRCEDTVESTAEPAENADDAPNSAPHAPDPKLLRELHDGIAARKKALDSLVSVPPKLTVSLLKHGLIDYEDAELAAESERKLNDAPAFIVQAETANAAEKGTAMHVFMQFAQFAACENDGCAAEADRLAEESFLTEKQRGLLDTDALDAFFRTPLYETIRTAKQVYRELRFNLKVAAKEVLRDAPSTDDFVLVQGVIDCFLENADGSYTVIDFKTDRVRAEDAERVLIERYRAQLAFYCRAVEDMTGSPVSHAILFSFAHMREIPVSSEQLLL